MKRLFCALALASMGLIAACQSTEHQRYSRDEYNNNNTAVRSPMDSDDSIMVDQQNGNVAEPGSLGADE
jgi:hypothetical protein